MRVLLLGPYPPPHGGVQTNLVAIHRLLLRRHIPSTVVNLTRYRQADTEHVYYPKSAFQVLRLLLTLRYDIIHMHIGGNLATRLLALGLFCCLMPGRKTVLTFHSGGYPSSPAGRKKHPRTFCGFVLRRFDRLIGVNQEIVDFFHRVGVSPQRTRLIPPHSFPAESEQHNGALPTHVDNFLQSHRPRLIAVSGLEPQYDLSLQIEVMGRVREKLPEAGLVIIGSGHLEAELRSQIQAKPYTDHILLCGDLPHAATLQAIARSDLMLRTTFYDGDAISVREAMHLGTPVIATDNGMRPAGVRLIPQRNLAALDQAIKEALAAPTSGRCSQTAADEGNVEAVLDLYRELLSSQDPTEPPLARSPHESRQPCEGIDSPT
ncbi:MAG TPA: glycosyltransferase family 4 protein [Gemmataceae bacterium]|nr:glycosyltransferase family 4 protein [Gemmataceae bacterium]